MEVLFYTILTLCALGVLSAVILYFVAQKFRVEEDPRIDEVEKMLPGANCGGCGFAGCRGMADALVKQDDISALFCPVGGGDCMKAVAAYLGKSAPEKERAGGHRALRRHLRQAPPHQRVQRCQVVRRGVVALCGRDGLRIRLPRVRGLRRARVRSMRSA